MMQPKRNRNFSGDRELAKAMNWRSLPPVSKLLIIRKTPGGGAAELAAVF
jgi:hypothetical protein